MSYDIQLFNPKTSKAREGMRLAKVSYKTPKNGGPKKDSKCVSVPPIRWNEYVGDKLPLLIPHIEAYLENVQDSIIRERVEENAVLITASDISIEKVLEYLDAESRGDRLTKELIAEWFTAELQDNLTVALADKFGISDEPSPEEYKRIQQAITVYKDKLCSLAGGRTLFPANVAEKLLKAVELANEHPLTTRFAVRLQSMMQRSDDDLLAAL